jgi:hypothetical protein
VPTQFQNMVRLLRKSGIDSRRARLARAASIAEMKQAMSQSCIGVAKA